MSLSILMLIIIPLSTAFLIPLIDIINKRLRKYLVVGVSFLEVILIGRIIIDYRVEGYKDYFSYYLLGGWGPEIGINIAVDGLGLFFTILINIAMFLIILYSIGFIGHHEGKYYVLLFLLFAAMQGVVLTGDIFNQYVFIELITVASAPLVAFTRTEKGTEAGIKYLIYGIISGLLFFIGIVIIYQTTGALNMAIVADRFKHIPLTTRNFIKVIFLTSLLIKLGVFPFHFWLAKAHSACPSSISALLSGLLLKVYIYVFIRLFWTVFGINQGDKLLPVIIYMALVSSLLGHIFALQEEDIKRVLAFSSIAHTGIIIGSLFLGSISGVYGGLIHVISHLTMKITLFLGVGYLLKFTSEHRIKKLKGIAYINPPVTLSIFTAGLAMIGIPPLNGFYGKWFILKAFLEKGHYFGAFVVLFGSFLSVIYYLRIYKYMITRVNVDYNENNIFETSVLFPGFHREQAVVMVVLIFFGLVVLSGFFYYRFDGPLLGAAEALLDNGKYISQLLGR
ncbi:complex I subunit 5 family protein [Halothermothrix orenii]|uniref:NADH dehydrogenase I subunit L n=1 Tax=Halothermothrix orenii (strain H 168 / OCM 544 / DSM 9562) TaxID=373903 RepID=B8CXD7_HALOH|nr:proton-conducting transporter membrane subunit [Halothermothrix orenii]ACL69956.1 NADH dehydrogenase I subunit L [Halothermothrix orenii H 168]